MKFIKLSLLVLPFMVMADNPIVPMDVDAVEEKATEEVAQVEERSVSVTQYESSSSYSDAGGIEDVIVTATRRETDIMETPLAISAVTQDELTRYGISNIKDLSYSLPGLAIQNSDTNAPIITLRGIRSNNVTEVGDPAVGVHVDGLYQSRPQGAQALMFDLERAELARGPQGTLFGRNSIAGSLNIITAKPNLEVQGGSITVNAGRYEERGIQGHYNLPITDDIAIRFAFSDQSKDSYLDGYYDPNGIDHRFLPANVLSQAATVDTCGQRRGNSAYAWFLGCNNPERADDAAPGFDQGYQYASAYKAIKADPSTFYNNVDNHAFRVSALFIIDDTSDLNFQYEIFQDDGAGWMNGFDCDMIKNRTGRTFGGAPSKAANTCADILGAGSSEYTAFVNTPGVNDLQIESMRWIYNKDFGDVQMVAKLGTQALEQYSQFDIDGGRNEWQMAMVLNDYKADSTTLDVQFTGASETLSWVVGAFYLEEENDMEAFFHATFNGDNIFIQPDRTIESKALFGQATMKLRDDLYLTLGIRHSEDDKSDVGGKNYECSIWNSCYPSAEIWGNRQLFMPTLNALEPDFHIAGGKYAGINCTNFGGPYGGNPNHPYLGATGCMVQTANNATSQSYNSTDWRIGLDWDVTDNSFIYTYLATGYKAGSIADEAVRGANTLHPEGPGSSVNTSYGPEEATTFELGYKGKFLENRLSLSANYYHTVYDGKQFTGNVPYDVIAATEYDIDTQTLVDVQQVVTFWGTQNFGEQEMQGLEVEFDFIPYDGGRLSGWVTTMDTEVTEDFNTQWYYGQDAYFGRPDYDTSVANVPENYVNLKGNEAPYSPNLAFTVKYEHTFNLGSMGQITPAINYHWQAEDYLTIWNADKHINDDGGYGGYGCVNPSADDGCGYGFYDLPGYFSDSTDIFGDQRSSWSMVDLIVTYKPAGDAPWYAQAFAYNVTDEVISYWRGVEAGVPSGAFSAPTQYGVRVGYYW
jgi:iron complex outermembrane receptor protein